MDDASEVLKRQSAMEADRTNFDAIWQDVAQHLLPRQADFLDLSGIRPQGNKRTSKIFDSTAMLAMDRGIAVCEAYSMPKGTRWQVLAPRDDELGKLRHVREWYQRKTAQLFQLRTMPFSGFDTQAHESWASLLAFGNQATWIEVRRDKMGRPLGLFYRSEHIGSIWAREDAWGRVDTMHRRMTLSARQAAQLWPNEIPPSAAKALKGPNPNPECRHDYLEVIEPNAQHEEGRMDRLGKPWACYHVDISAKAIFGRGGYRSLPRVYSRYEKAPFETYGRGPGMSVLPDVKQCQQMVRDIMTACEFMGRPALLARDDDLDGLIQYFAGGVADAFRAKAHEIGLPPRWAKAIADWNNEFVTNDIAERNKASEAELNAFKASTPDYDAKLASAQGLFKSLGLDEAVVTELDVRLGTGNLMKLAFGLAEKFGEPVRVDPEDKGGGLDGGNVDNAKAQIREFDQVNREKIRADDPDTMRARRRLLDAANAQAAR